MQLEVCRELGRIAPRRRGVSTLAERAQRLGDRDTVPVATIPDARCEATEHRRGPEEAHPDPRELGHPAFEALSVDHRSFSESSSGPNDTSAKTSRSTALAGGIARTISAAYFGFRRAVSRARSASGSTV